MEALVRANAGLLALLAVSGAAPQSANQEAVLRRFAGTWDEISSKRKVGAGPNLRFRRTPAGGLEELRGPEANPVVQPVILDGKPHQLAGSKNSIAWREIAANRFERRIFGDGQKLLYTRRLAISSNGNALTEEVKRVLGGGGKSVSTAVYRRVEGQPPGLAGTWKRESLHGGNAGQMRIESVGAGTLKVTSDSLGGSEYTVTLGGQPAPVMGPAIIPNMMVVARQLDDHSLEFTNIREGTAAFTSLMRVSANGKTLTVTNTGYGPDGKPREPGVSVFEKQ